MIVYDRTANGVWSLDTTLTATDGTGGAEFGASISLYRALQSTTPFALIERLAVGAPDQNISGTYLVGEAYVFNAAPSWHQVQKITHTTAGDHQWTFFGEAVAIRGEDLFIGSPGAYTFPCQSIPRCGEVYHFEMNSAGIWIRDFAGISPVEGNLGGNPPGAQVGMRFGSSIALGLDDLLAVGAFKTDGFTAGNGLALDVGLVELSPVSNPSHEFGEVRPALAVGELDEGHFGTSVEFSDRYMVVGYPDSGSVSGGRLGSVHIFGPDRIFADGFESE